MMERRAPKRRTWWLFALAGLAMHPAFALVQDDGAGRDPLRYTFRGRYGQVEVGGPFAGMEFHNSRPAPSRISFYAPVANSIDLSTDYWKRGLSLPMAIGLRVAGGPVEWVSREAWPYVLSPHRVTFFKRTDSLSIDITYEFCRTAPAAVLSVTVRNASGVALPVEVYSHLVLSLRTCQTYARKDTSLLRYDGATRGITAGFEDAATDSATVFVENAGALPVTWAFRAEDVGATDEGGSSWPAARMAVGTDSVRRTKAPGVAAFVYAKLLRPVDSLAIVQIIGSCAPNDAPGWRERLRNGWRAQVKAYDDFIRGKAEQEARFVTGDSILDRSGTWARGLIAANAHYLNNRIVPMPCPAEYNFFFTHDLLLTNLGAVNFDIARVKRDLRYVVSLARDSVIPHAYYWRDDGFKTEYCEPENWNHLWFLLVSGSYLRHSLDDSTGRLLYPFLTKSIHDVLTRLHGDGLMYAYRPDWWDIGHVEGPRAYLTALATKALREYLFISAFLHRGGTELKMYEETAARMQHALAERLWDPEEKYLTNFNAGAKDDHFYAGSLIASVYGLLDSAKSDAMVATAGRVLVDGRIGLRIAGPPDFNLESVIASFKLAGQEAGPAYAYANGGVWPHGNAWYALALRSIGKTDSAAAFVRRVMTLDGVANSPKGTPAMYEYRYSNPGSTEFGTIDKPSFLWAGGMYLQVLYRLFGVEESEWNVRVSAPRPSAFDSVVCTMTFGTTAVLTSLREGVDGGTLTANGRSVPSIIFPLDLRSVRVWGSRPNREKIPVLERVNAIVHRVTYDRATRRLTIGISSFEGHRVECVVASHGTARRVTVDGVLSAVTQEAGRQPGMDVCTVRLTGTSTAQTVMFEY